MITSFYAGILGILLTLISWETILVRRKLKISLGMGENNEIAHLVSAHSNFCSYTAIMLILLYFAETSHDFHFLLIHLLGLMFTIGRFYHYFAFRSGKVKFKYRVRGMRLTLIPLVVLSLLNLYSYILKIGHFIA